MTDSKREPDKRFEDLMRNAPARIRDFRRRELERDRLLRKPARERRRAKRAGTFNPQRMIEQIEIELAKLHAKLDTVHGQQSRILLKAEIRHLEQMKDHLIGKRRPPESGIAVPAIPPSGPLPKKGGAAAPLDFER